MHHLCSFSLGLLYIFVVISLVSDIAIFVLKRDVKLQLTNCGYFSWFFNYFCFLSTSQEIGWEECL